MNRVYDIVVLGGGIHGAACAQAAAAKNYSVLLLEKNNQPGLATSSASSKLIHGGLRYLETGQFKLVYECLRERRYLLRNAPHLVHLEKFFIPVYSSTRRRPWQILTGLLIYSCLSGKKFNIIRKKNWPALDGLKQAGLQAVFQYWDAQTDDRQLTRAVMASAQSLGADVITRAHFESSVYQNTEHIVHYRADQQHSVKAKVIINCTGPWVNQSLAKISPAVSPLPMELVLGTHIVIDRPLQQGMYYLESPADGRAVFVMPWQGKTLIGTTEVSFKDSPDNIAPPQEDIAYLLDVYQRYFDGALEPQDVKQAFAGCRVLPAGGHSAFHKPRETIIYEAPQAVFSIYGGKLTAHRATAENVMKRLAGYLPPRQAKADTRHLKLPVIP